MGSRFNIGGACLHRIKIAYWENLIPPEVPNFGLSQRVGETSDRSLIFRALIDHIGADAVKLLSQPQGFVQRYRFGNGHLQFVMR